MDMNLYIALIENSKHEVKEFQEQLPLYIDDRWQYQAKQEKDEETVAIIELF